MDYMVEQGFRLISAILVELDAIGDRAPSAQRVLDLSKRRPLRARSLNGRALVLV